MRRTVAGVPHLRSAGLVIAVASLVAIGFATLLPETGPAVDSHSCLICGPLGGVSAVLNILLFVPLGIALALSGFTGKRAVIATCALSVLIESAQFLLIPGRNSTIGDVITNSIGGAIGFAIGRYAFILLRPSPRIALALTMGWSVVWLAIQTTSAFGFSPVIPRSEYYGEIAPRLGNFEQFRGRILQASIADVTVPDERFKDGPRLRELLLGGATVTTTIVPAGPIGGVAPIVRVADDSQSEMLLLAQNGSDLFFGVRTGAAVLRLRPPVFALPGVVQSVSGSDSGLAMDTLTVTASFSSREFWMNTQSRTSNHLRIRIVASLGWIMLSPFQWFIEETPIELVLSAIWIACLLVPIGYWGVGVTGITPGPDAAKTRMTALLIASVLLYAGLVAVPHAFGINSARPIDWFAAVAGIILGSACASVVGTGIEKRSHR